VVELRRVAAHFAVVHCGVDGDARYSTLTEWLLLQRKDVQAVAVRRFETPPGRQAQVDWRRLVSLSEVGAEHKLWGFTLRWVTAAG
jgi:transposase